MMKKEIKFSLVYRDMWQSSGKYQPRVDQLVRIAPLIVEMGCFARVETNGGAFEQVNLLYGENPNKAVRAFTAPFREAGIQTHMLDRGLNALRMYPVPADVRRLMYKVKHAQGVDITRIFCGLNETRNIIPSIKYALEAGILVLARDDLGDIMAEHLPCGVNSTDQFHDGILLTARASGLRSSLPVPEYRSGQNLRRGYPPPPPAAGRRRAHPKWRCAPPRSSASRWT